ncbi:MAG: ribbon-helix-helix domain-containing protein [Candidatus Bathyarchaeia archaeon]
MRGSDAVLKSKPEQKLMLNTKPAKAINTEDKEKMATIHKKRVNVTMAAPYLDGMELLIKDGLYESQAEIVKDALRRLFNHYEIQSISEICSQ